MPQNRTGIIVERKCNDCGATETKAWYYDKAKGIGFKCTNCYNIWYAAMKKQQKKNPDAPVLINKKITLNEVIEKVLKYLIESQPNDHEFHTTTSIANGIGCNYAITHKAIRMIDVMNTHFFSQYNFNLKKLKTNVETQGHRDKLEIITITERKDKDV